VRDILTAEQVNEIADAPPGITKEAVHTVTERAEETSRPAPSAPAQSTAQSEIKQGYATIQRDGKVEFSRTP
jgi:hypothetical protein